jgi:hypothetical protein
MKKKMRLRPNSMTAMLAVPLRDEIRSVLSPQVACVGERRHHSTPVTIVYKKLEGGQKLSRVGRSRSSVPQNLLKRLGFSTPTFDISKRPQARPNTSSAQPTHHASTNTAAHGRITIFVWYFHIDINLPPPILAPATPVTISLNSRVSVRHARRIQSQDPPRPRRILRQRQNLWSRSQRPEAEESHSHRLRRWSDK